MRIPFLFLVCLLLAACKTTKTPNQPAATASTSAGYETPTNLEGPTYDPATSPQVMTQNTVLPTPPGTQRPATTQQPAAYGTPPSANTDSLPPTYGSTPTDPYAYPSAGNQGGAPATYGSAPAADPMASKGEVAAPRVYSNGVASFPTGEAAVLAANLTGLWVNATDNLEVVEFTPDHYSTFYDGKLLLQEAMRYHVDCPGDCSGGTPLGISCFTISGPAGTDCYGIVRLTPNVLELSMLGVSTETIIYQKK